MMRIGISVMMAALVAGCATPQFAPVTRYVIHAPVEVAPVTSLDKTLGVRALEAARPYRQKIVYRDSDYAIRAYETEEWAELPADAVTRALTDALIAIQRFKDIGNAADLTRPDLVLTGMLRTFDEVRTTKPWSAECEVRLELREAQGTAVLWAATLTARENLEQNDVSALPAAMSRAVASIVRQAAEQIAAR